MDIRRLETKTAGNENGGVVHAIFPWAGVTTPPYGAVVLRLDSASKSECHVHNGEGAYIFFEGNGFINVGDERAAVRKGDVVFLPKHSRHFVENTSPTQTVVFMRIWWGAAAAPSNAPYKTVMPPRPAFF